MRFEDGSGIILGDLGRRGAPSKPALASVALVLLAGAQTARRLLPPLPEIAPDPAHEVDPPDIPGPAVPSP